MLSRKILLVVLLIAAVAASAQSETSPSSTETAAPVAASQAGGTGGTPLNSPALPDSTSLEPIKINRADYPQLAAERGIQGQVIIKVHVSESGDVEQVDIVSGDPILADAAVRAAKKWKFKPFIKNGRPTRVAAKVPMDFAFAGKIMDKGRSADGTTVADKGTYKLPPALAATIESNSSTVTDSSGTDTQGAPKRVRVSQGVSQGLLIHQVAPIYPRSALINHVTGAVLLHALIGKDGRISDLKVFSGPPELRDAAIGAVQQWRYKPYYLKGQPVEVETQISVNFTMR